MKKMESISSKYMSSITWAGAIQEYKNLAILPLFSNQSPKAHYIGLNEAIAKNQIKITEVDEFGSVPTLIAINEGSIPILLLQGEEVEGAMQNRVLNTTIMLKEHSKTMIPVTCTEEGRWSYSNSGNNFSFREQRLRNQSQRNDPFRGRSCTYGSVFQNNSTSDVQDLIDLWDDADTRTENSENEESDMPITDGSTTIADSFTNSYNIMPPLMRKRILSSVSTNLEDGGSYRSDQKRVWNEVNLLSHKLQVQSDTSAINDAFTEKHDTLSEFVEAFHCLPGQQGALVFLNGKVESLDIFSNESAYEGYQEKLIKSYAMEAMVTEESNNQKPSHELAEAFIQNAAHSNESKHSSVGIGHDYRLQGSEVIGSALVHEEEVIHITLLSDSE